MSRVIAGLLRASGSEREESPDSGRGELARVGHGRATRLVTPGGCAFGLRKRTRMARLRKVPQKIKPPVSLHLGGRPSGKPEARLFRSSAFGKGEKVG